MTRPPPTVLENAQARLAAEWLRGPAAKSRPGSARHHGEAKLLIRGAYPVDIRERLARIAWQRASRSTALGRHARVSQFSRLRSPRTRRGRATRSTVER